MQPNPRKQPQQVKCPACLGRSRGPCHLCDSTGMVRRRPVPPSSMRRIKCRLATELGRRIRAMRLDRGLTAAALADTLGMYPSQVRSWELGTRSPNARNLARLALALDVEPAELFPPLAVLRGSEVGHAA